MDGAERRAFMKSWLVKQGLRNPEAMAEEDYNALKELLSDHNQGFGVFWSILAFFNQQATLQLKNCNLASEQGRADAAKLQGQMLALDMVYELVLNIVDPFEGTDSETHNEQEGSF